MSLRHRQLAFIPGGRAEFWMRWLGIPLISIFIIVVGEYDRIGDPAFWLSEGFWPRLLLVLILTVIIWEGNVRIYAVLDQRYPWARNPRRRLLMQGLASISFSLLVIAVPAILIPETFGGSDFLGKSILLGLMISICVNAIYIGWHFLEEWKLSLTLAEQLKRQNIESRFEMLKNQVNPHFLFNSLNTLVTLIEEDRDTAICFTEQLARIYRYVLQNKDKELVPLATELNCVQAYLYLLQTRFGDNLRVSVDVSELLREASVAPLALQMLIENAVKHNVVSRDAPLTIEVFVDGDRHIVVRNTVNKKKVTEDSTRVGLQNIRDRYSFLSSSQVVVENDTKSFAVKLPLLEAV